MATKSKNKPVQSTEPNYYRLTNIKKEEAEYNVIVGERSNGKTYSCLEEVLINYAERLEKGAYIRRWAEDFRQGRASTLFEPFEKNGEIERIFKGQWSGVRYYSMGWYLIRKNEKGVIVRDEKPFMYGFALTDMEHDKSTSYPDVTTIIFDEFLSRTRYIPNEFVLFQNVLSTIIRLRDNVRIYMLANTVAKYSLYYEEMGIDKIRQQKQGTIDVYRLGEDGAKIAVEYCSNIDKSSKKSNKYFAFNNPHLQMIKHGGWEIDIYPHLPDELKYEKTDIIEHVFIIWEEVTLQGEIVSIGDKVFIYWHKKTTPIQKNNTSLVYTRDLNLNDNYRKNILKPWTDGEKRLLKLIQMEYCFYQTNDVGEVFRTYYNWCKTYQQFN